MSNSFQPLYYDQLNLIDNAYQPSVYRSRNNVSFYYWQRSLFQRACSTLIFDLPETWQGSVKDFFYYCLFRFGFVVVFNVSEYGTIFQPCNLSGFDLYYQPTIATCANKALSGKIDILKLHENASCIKLTPDFKGIFDIINFYADKIAELDGSLSMSLINSKLAYLVGAKTKPGAEALKKMLDKVNQGQPAVIFDSKLISDDPISKDSPFQVWNQKVKENYLAEELLNTFETLLYNFDSEVGIPTINNTQKKERMVVSEAEARTIDATSRSIIWFDTLKSSLKEVNEIFGLDIDVSLRYVDNDNINTNENIDREGSENDVNL